MEAVVQRLGEFLAKRVVGEFFIDYVATRTLKNIAKYFAENGKKEKTG